MADQDKHKRARKCANCACFDPIPKDLMAPDDNEYGYCRSQAPRLRMTGDSFGSWPIVSANSWCVEGYKAALVPRRES